MVRDGHGGISVPANLETGDAGGEPRGLLGLNAAEEWGGRRPAAACLQGCALPAPHRDVIFLTRNRYF